MERIKPVVLENTDGAEYTLEYNRASVRKAEMDGFNLAKLKGIEDGITVTVVEDLFYYSFLMHHKGISRREVGAIFDEMGGIPQELLTRLVELYANTYSTLIQTEESGKNSKWAVRM